MSFETLVSRQANAYERRVIPDFRSEYRKKVERHRRARSSADATLLAPLRNK